MLTDRFPYTQIEQTSEKKVDLVSKTPNNKAPLEAWKFRVCINFRNPRTNQKRRNLKTLIETGRYGETIPQSI